MLTKVSTQPIPVVRTVKNPETLSEKKWNKLAAIAARYSKNEQHKQ